jgi:hypothetical protein
MLRLILTRCLLQILNLSAFAQQPTLIGTDLVPRCALIEQFGGTYCMCCPEGDSVAYDVFTDYPDKVCWYNIHSSFYGGYIPGVPNLISARGDSMVTVSGLYSVPTAMINRTIFNGFNRDGLYTMSRQNYDTATSMILNSGNSLVNIGMESTYDWTNEQFDVDVERYSTASETTINKLHVVLIEDSIYGFQDVLGVLDTNYLHKYVMRYMATGIAGEEVTNTSAISLFQASYSIPNDSGFIPVQCQIVAFVTQGDFDNVHTVQKVGGTIGSTVGVEQVETTAAFSVDPNPINTHATVDFGSLQSGEVSMFDLYGKRCASHRFNNQKRLIIKRKQLPVGNYLLQTQLDNGQSLTKQVVIR